jgi:hypothetical protein
VLLRAVVRIACHPRPTDSGNRPTSLLDEIVGWPDSRYGCPADREPRSRHDREQVSRRLDWVPPIESEDQFIAD